MSALFADFSLERAAAPGHIRRPSTFLSLAPVRSSSYPVAPPVSSPVVESVVHTCTNCGHQMAPPSPEIKPITIARRSSSASSITGGTKKRFLKLGPVHWGGMPGDDDYAVED